MPTPTYIHQDELAEEYRHLLDPENMAELEGVPNLFRMLANNPPLLRSFMLWSGTLWEEAGLSARQRELVILTVARELESEYEWNQHVSIAADIDLSKSEILDLADGDDEEFPETEQLLIEFTRKACTRTVGQDDTEALCQMFDDRTVIGVVLLIGNYIMTDLIVDTLAIDLDSPFIGWELKHL
jgi:alkylhydroperoxidase family enzyme